MVVGTLGLAKEGDVSSQEFDKVFLDARYRVAAKRKGNVGGLADLNV